MTAPTHEETPGAVAAAAEGQTKRSGARASSSPSLTDFDPHAPVDLATLTNGEFCAYLSGRCHGYAAAFTELADAVAPHAVQVVHALANVPPRDRDADRQQAEQRAAWWARRRGAAA